MATEDYSAFIGSLTTSGAVLGTDLIPVLRSGSNVNVIPTGITWLNVQAHGVLTGNSSSTNATNFNAMVQANKATQGVSYYFPLGTYNIGSTINLTDSFCFNIIGDSKDPGNDSGGSVIAADFSGALLNMNYGVGSGTFRIENIQIFNTHVSGIGIDSFNQTTCKFDSVDIAGGNGGTYTDFTNRTNIGIRMQGYSTCYTSCNFMNAGVGAMIYSGGGGEAFHSCDWVSCGEGLRLAGTGGSIFGGRMEVCEIGMNLGTFPDGTTFAEGNSTFSGMSMEACDVFILAKSVSSSKFEGISTHGSSNAPSGQSQHGFYITGINGAVVDNCAFGGSNDGSSCYGRNASIASLSFNETLMDNGNPNGKTWEVKIDPINIKSRGSDVKMSPSDTLTYPSIFGAISVQSLQQINLLNPAVQGANLGQKFIPVPAGATSLAILFTPTGLTSPTLQTFAATTGGSLPAGTYQVATTFITARGESATGGIQSVVVGGSNNAIHLQGFGASGAGYARRYYITNGSTDIFGNYLWLGFFQTAENVNPLFLLTQISTFDGLGSPPMGGTGVATDMQEPDSNYVPVFSTDWNSGHCYDSSRATSGLTANWPNAAPSPDGTGHISVFVYRC